MSAPGPLIVSPDNPRYFAQPDGTPVYFSGSHTWNNLQEWFDLTPFDFEAYLDFKEANSSTFIRLWAHEVPRGAGWTRHTFLFDPLPFARPGPGTAADGKPKFDLMRFNQDYFDRLRARVIAAGERGIYVGIMLFNGFSLWNKGEDGVNPWTYHPFNLANNVNGIDGDPSPATGDGQRLHTLAIPSALSRQKAYVEKVIDTVNNLDNVLYEIANEDEPEAEAWQNELIAHINTYQAAKAQQHPVGMTVLVNTGVGYNYQACLDSDAEWVSPGNTSPFNSDALTETDGSKVVVIDIDHTRPTAATSDVWTWRSFLRGYNVIHMDALGGTRIAGKSSAIVSGLASYDAPMRRGMKQTSLYAARCDLRTTVPHSALSSTGYCIAEPGSQYLTLAPSGGTFTVDLSAGLGRKYRVEWLKVSDGTISMASAVGGGSGSQSFSSPFGNSTSVLFLNEIMPAEPVDTIAPQLRLLHR